MITPLATPRHTILQSRDVAELAFIKEGSRDDKTQIVLCPNLETDCLPHTDMGIGDVFVIEIPISAGDFLVQADTYVTLECDKASIELPSPFSGRVVKMFVKIGDKVTPNSPIMEIEVLSNVIRDDLSAGESEQHVYTPSTVFLVHGHNEAIREMSARLLEKLGLKVVILNEQASASDTIIEKLEQYANVHFAVVLMTADDVGGKKNPAEQTLQDRARQNVVLELGYFMAKSIAGAFAFSMRKAWNCLRTTTESFISSSTMAERGATRSRRN